MNGLRGKAAEQALFFHAAAGAETSVKPVARQGNEAAAAWRACSGYSCFHVLPAPASLRRRAGWSGMPHGLGGQVYAPCFTVMMVSLEPFIFHAPPAPGIRASRRQEKPGAPYSAPHRCTGRGAACAGGRAVVQLMPTRRR